MPNEQIIKAINTKVYELTESEKESINELLLFHEFEPSAAAERIAEELDVSYEVIHDIIFELY